MGHGSALKTLLLNIQFYVLVKTIDLYIHPSNSYNLVAKTLPVESCACVSCGAPVTRENDIRWKSFTFVIWRRPRARCCRCCRSSSCLQTVCSCFLPSDGTSAPVPSSVNTRNYCQFLPTLQHCTFFSCISPPPRRVPSVAGCLLVP